MPVQHYVISHLFKKRSQLKYEKMVSVLKAVASSRMGLNLPKNMPYESTGQVSQCPQPGVWKYPGPKMTFLVFFAF